MARKRDRRSAKKEAYYIVCILTVLLIVAFSIFGPGGYQDLRKARLELQERRTRVDQVNRGIQERNTNVEKLRSDKHAIEALAREKNYARDGEVIQILPKEPKKSK